ncbi:MAG: NAD(P)/FAD-dependent oxidoreductase [Proteobacteria bacterium]|nr:NAD(P)/FAD-dependent oxidoreductase [Pseudomonadota bacterium]
MSSPRAGRSDCVVVGASFAGLACALALARAGVRVTIAEKKTDPGAKLHTTGILVRDVVDGVPILQGLPASLVRRVDAVRLYAPNLRSVDLRAPGYYFLATDTPGVLRWLADRAVQAGAELRCDTAFRGAQPLAGGYDLGAPLGRTDFIVGADGPASRVAKALGLGTNRQFLAGIEHEYPGAQLGEPGFLHCFIDRRLMPGYIGWMVQGVHGVQVGLARRLRAQGAAEMKSAMAGLLAKLAPIADFRGRAVASVRAGLIPCGGLVRPLARARALLVGDAAGLVSPVTAGGIHTALAHGLAAGDAVADFLAGRSGDPRREFIDTYPRFRVKRLLRFAFDHFQSDTFFNLALATEPMRWAAGRIYFHQRAVMLESPAEQRRFEAP